MRVNYQLHEEAMPFFYRSKTFVFDCSAVGAMRFLHALPTKALENIASVAFTIKAVDANDTYTCEAWYPDISQDGWRFQGPFAWLLTTKLPKLADIYLCTPCSRGAD
ncbi:hypothetical protein BU23DRAFT_254040 [Bimuria novae-zelandiae CBS 107.79]|uniref:Uncharacterized protein n=1 Tax=Bimuria novae-zelandiae CBS 107.79 TaxID=1447943 RepID=A0A6A5VLW5_9PLEO|nr:hypothetical protein BU23DRAFT_254040 [Bimuria novae-zelandiae CBS 107.79]